MMANNEEGNYDDENSDFTYERFLARERSVSDVCEVLTLHWSFRGEL